MSAVTSGPAYTAGMEFIVMRSGQIIHEEPMVPGAQPVPVGIPAVEGVGEDEHLGQNELEGWKVEVRDLDALLNLIASVQGQVAIRRPMDFMLGGRPAFVLDVTPGIGQ
jgi:hypothetical protein